MSDILAEQISDKGCQRAYSIACRYMTKCQ